MANTTNYNWETPDDTDLVKDGAAAIRTLGSAIDTTVFNNASAAIAKSIIDAKGDLISATTADTPARLAVGADGTYLQADSSTATGLKWGTVSAGGMTELASGTLSSTAVTLSSISQSYKHLQLVIRDPQLTSTATRLALRWNGVTSAAYRYRWIEDTSLSQGNALDRMWASVQDLPTTSDKWHLVYNFFDYTSANNPILQGFGNENGGPYYYRGSNNSNAAITQIIITTQNGTSTFSGGSYILYGVA